jgi:hypothetical protein
MREEIEIIHPEFSEQLPQRDVRSHPIVFQTEILANNKDGYNLCINNVGVSAFCHDSAAALIVDGAVEAAAQEEHFTRKKTDGILPDYAIMLCLTEGGIDLKVVNYITFYDKSFIEFLRQTNWMFDRRYLAFLRKLAFETTFGGDGGLMMRCRRAPGQVPQGICALRHDHQLVCQNFPQRAKLPRHAGDLACGTVPVDRAQRLGSGQLAPGSIAPAPWFPIVMPASTIAR